MCRALPEVVLPKREENVKFASPNYLRDLVGLTAKSFDKKKERKKCEFFFSRLSCFFLRVFTMILLQAEIPREIVLEMQARFENKLGI